MPWRHVEAKSQRLQFVRDARRRLMTFTELCARYGISRVTGYKWLERAERSGLDFLQELSRRPHSCPHATPVELQARLLDARRHHPTWGPRKLLALVHRQDRRQGTDFAWHASQTPQSPPVTMASSISAYFPNTSVRYSGEIETACAAIRSQ